MYRLPSFLKYIHLKTISYEECTDKIESKYMRFIKAPTICALAEKHAGTSKGDTGCPLFMNDKLIGIVRINSCGSAKPDVFTRLSPYTSWIESITGVKAVSD